MFKDFTVSIVVPDNTPFSTDDYRLMIERAVAELPGVTGVDDVSPMGSAVEEKPKKTKATVAQQLAEDLLRLEFKLR